MARTFTHIISTVVLVLYLVAYNLIECSNFYEWRTLIREISKATA